MSFDIIRLIKYKKGLSGVSRIHYQLQDAGTKGPADLSSF